MKLLKQIGIPSIIILLMQLSMYPYVFQMFFGLPRENVMGIVFFVIIFLYCLTIKHRQRGVPIELIIIMALQCVGWLFYFMMFEDSSYFTRIFFIALTFLSLSMLLWKNCVYQYSDVYFKFLTLQGVLGVVAFILVFVGILHPLISLAIDNSFSSVNFYGLTCSNSVYGNFMRVGGFFDEPGAFAFWGVFALLFNKLTVDNRKLEIILIVSLLFTFSAAYFVVLPIYLVCFYSTKLKTMILTLLILVPLIFVISKTLSSNSDFLRFTVERFSGDRIYSTRYDQADEAEAIFRKAPVFGIGGRNFGEQGNTIADNPYEILAKDGVVGFVITYLPLLFVIVKYWRRREVLFSSAILFIEYMQRPFHINEMHYLMLYLFSLMVILKYGKETTKKLYPYSIDRKKIIT